MWVADRGFASTVNRAHLAEGGGHYIHAEKLRATNAEAAAELARPGRYHTVAGNLRVKEAWSPPGTLENELVAVERGWRDMKGAQVMSNLFAIDCPLSAEVRTWMASPSAARPSGAMRSSSR